MIPTIGECPGYCDDADAVVVKLSWPFGACPLVSWKMSLIGDPLYTPYKSNPAMRIEDLPPAMQRVFSDGKQ